MKHALRPLSLYLVAGEESGDALGGALARALLAQEQRDHGGRGERRHT